MDLLAICQEIHCDLCLQRWAMGSMWRRVHGELSAEDTFSLLDEVGMTTKNWAKLPLFLVLRQCDLVSWWSWWNVEFLGDLLRKSASQRKNNSWDSEKPINQYFMWDTLWLFNIAMENPNHKWRSIAGKIIYKWAIYTMAMLNNQRVSWDIEKLRQVVNPMVDQPSGKSQCLDRSLLC